MTAAAAPRPDLAPYLFYADVEQAVGFLCDAFGFRVTFTSTDPDGGLAHAQLAHGDALVMLGRAGDGGPGMARSAGQLPALHAGVYVYVDDVDQHCRHAEQAGAKVLIAPADQPWGDRMYCAVDGEGQFWMFARRPAVG